MLDVVNALACSVVFGYCFIASSLMPGRGMWGRRAILWGVTVTVGLGMLAPVSDWLPPPAWQDVAMNLCLAVALIAWRREAMAFIRCKFAAPPDPALRRRTTDWAELTEGQAANVTGGKQ